MVIHYKFGAGVGLLLVSHLVGAQMMGDEGTAADAARAETVASIDAAPTTASVPVSPTDEAADVVPGDAQKKTGFSSRFVEEIIVTAQKREENVLDVPISINAFSAGALDARGIVDPKDLPLATPGLTVGSQAGFTVTYLRGIGSDAFLLGDPSVALYIDGIYFPFSHGQAQNFGAIERVEVLKGPQGTLFGRNAVGGAISVSTQKPEFDDTSGSIQASYASYDDVQTKVAINLPLAETVALGVSGIYNTADNYRDGEIGDGGLGKKELPKETTRGARIRLRWAPSETFDFTLSGFHLEQQGVSTMFSTNSAPQGLGVLIQPQTGLDGVNDAPTYFDLDNRVVYGEANVFLDWFDVKFLGSHQKIATDSLYDFDGSPLPLVQFEAFQRGNIKTAEAQLISNETSWAADRFKWIFGYYYFQGRQGLQPANFGVTGSVLGQLAQTLRPVLDTVGGLIGRTIPDLVDGNLLQATGILDTDSNSIYAQGTWSFTGWMSLTLGARAQEEKRTIVKSGGAVIASLADIPYTEYSGYHDQLGPLGRFIPPDTTRSLSPKASLEFHPWDQGLIYTSYQKAVKSATFNVLNFLRFSTAQDLEPVKKEEMTAYEIGLKTPIVEGTTLSTAVFYYDIKNIQVQFISLIAGGAVTFENAPAAEVKGIDFDLVSELFPSITPGLVFTAGGAFVDAKFTDYPDGQGFSDTTGLYSKGNDYTGKRIPRSPRFSGTVGLSQTLDVPGGNVELAAEYYYNSGFFYLAQNSDFNEEKAYGVMGARLSYLYEPWNFRTTLFGKNILDERYNYSRFTSDFGGSDAVAPPATVGVRFNWEF